MTKHVRSLLNTERVHILVDHETGRAALQASDNGRYRIQANHQLFARSAVASLDMQLGYRPAVWNAEEKRLEWDIRDKDQENPTTDKQDSAAQ